MARPRTYVDGTRVMISPDGRTTLKKFSDRRAIVNAIIDHGGRMTLREIDDHFGFDMRERVLGLINGGWLKVVEE